MVSWKREGSWEISNEETWDRKDEAVIRLDGRSTSQETSRNGDDQWIDGKERLLIGSTFEESSCSSKYSLRINRRRSTRCWNKSVISWCMSW